MFPFIFFIHLCPSLLCHTGKFSSGQNKTKVNKSLKLGIIPLQKLPLSLATCTLLFTVGVMLSRLFFFFFFPPTPLSCFHSCRVYKRGGRGEGLRTTCLDPPVHGGCLVSLQWHQLVEDVLARHLYIIDTESNALHQRGALYLRQGGDGRHLLMVHKLIFLLGGNELASHHVIGEC